MIICANIQDFGELPFADHGIVFNFLIHPFLFHFC